MSQTCNRKGMAFWTVPPTVEKYSQHLEHNKKVFTEAAVFKVSVIKKAKTDNNVFESHEPLVKF